MARPGIFICYRRNDTRDIAGRIFAELKARYKNVFMDVNSLPGGQNFRVAIEAALDQCSVFLCLIGPDWLARDQGGTRRLDDPADTLRIEIETALTKELPIIPVLVRGASTPSEIELPDSLRPLTGYQAVDVPVDPYFDAGMRRLKKAIDAIMGPRWILRVVAVASAIALLAVTAFGWTYLRGPTSGDDIPAPPETGGLKNVTAMLDPPSQFRDCPDICPGMVVIPAGDFVMGSPETEDLRSQNEGPQLARTMPSIAVSTHEITFAQWDACVAAGGCLGYTPFDETWGRVDRPVVNVSWSDARAYAAWLSQRTSKSYRLLSEAEYEYAMRAGAQTAYWFGALFEEGRVVRGERTSRVGSLPANSWGLFDMSGNISEWTAYCYADRLSEIAPGQPDCAQRVVRGGSWKHGPEHFRSANRNGADPATRSNEIGFRVARDLSP